MLVSFVIAFLNEENNLSSAYKQVLSFKPPVDNVEWELILIDDGSTDKSWEIAKEIMGDYATYFEPENYIELSKILINKIK